MLQKVKQFLRSGPQRQLPCRAAAVGWILGYSGFKPDLPRALSACKLLHFSHLIQIKDGFCQTIMILVEINTQILR